VEVAEEVAEEVVEEVAEEVVDLEEDLIQEHMLEVLEEMVVGVEEITGDPIGIMWLRGLHGLGHVVNKVVRLMDV
jgi:hypothetical protein